GLLLVLNLLMIKRFSLFGIPNQEVGTRLSFISVGLWWGIFSIPLFAFVREKRKNLPMPGGRGYVYQGFNKIYITFKKIKNFNELVKFLISFLIYNDGIQTVVSMAVIFGRSALNLSTTTLIGTLLLIQFIGIPGSLIFGKLAERIGSKRTIFLTLIVWIGIVFYAYFMSGSLEFWILGGFVGLVLGGSQAISRSLYGSLIPERNTAEFFGFFAISNKFASIFGPLTFGVIESITGNPRKSILSVEIFFIIGIILLNFVNVKKGLEQAKVVI
ncbi:MAG: MFS transporter, partial [Fidelibacterota bacterium]